MLLYAKVVSDTLAAMCMASRLLVFMLLPSWMEGRVIEDMQGQLTR